MVIKGVLQGFVFESLLFITYINDLYNIKIQAKVFSFDDDMALNFYHKKILHQPHFNYQLNFL